MPQCDSPWIRHKPPGEGRLACAVPCPHGNGTSKTLTGQAGSDKRREPQDPVTSLVAQKETTCKYLSDTHFFLQSKQSRHSPRLGKPRSDTGRRQYRLGENQVRDFAWKSGASAAKIHCSNRFPFDQAVIRRAKGSTWEGIMGRHWLPRKEPSSCMRYPYGTPVGKRTASVAIS